MYLLLHGMPLALRLVSLDPFLTICSGLFMITSKGTYYNSLPTSSLSHCHSVSLSHSELLFCIKKLQFKTSSTSELRHK